MIAHIIAIYTRREEKKNILKKKSRRRHYHYILFVNIASRGNRPVFFVPFFFFNGAVCGFDEGTCAPSLPCCPIGQETGAKIVFPFLELFCWLCECAQVVGLSRWIVDY